MSKASMFGKLRKEAREAKKKNAEQRSEGMTEAETAVMRDVQEIQPVTQEELDVLLSALNDTPAEDKPASTSVEQEEAREAAAKVPEAKMFEAYGVFYDTTKKKFMKATVMYNPVSMTTSLAKLEDLSDGKAVASAKMAQVFNLKLMRNEEML